MMEALKMLSKWLCGSRALRRGAAILLACWSLVSVSAMNPVDSLCQRLKILDNSEDSIIVLYNLFEVVPMSQRTSMLEKMYEVSRRAGNEEMMFHSLNLLAAAFEQNDSMQTVLLERVLSLPESPIQQSSRLYIKLRASERDIRRMPEAERQKKMVDYMSRHRDSHHLNTYDRIEFLFYLCVFLRSASDGELLQSYQTELEHLIDSLPERDLMLKGLFYSQAAKSYLNNRMYAKSLEANKKMLDVNRQLDKKHEAMGLVFRSYWGSTYFCYHYMLMCAPVLTEEEIDEYYARTKEILQHSQRLRKNKNLQRYTDIAYLMAKKRYSEAIPLIKTELDVNNGREDRVRLIAWLRRAAKEAGSKDDRLFAMEEYIKIMESRLKSKAYASYKEMQILYEVNDLKETNDELALKNQLIETERHKTRVRTWAISMFVLVILLLVVFNLYRRSRKLAKKVIRTNGLLVEERDTLKSVQKDLIKARDKAKAADRAKTDFVNNISHEIRTPLAAIVEYSGLISDCADGDTRDYIKRFADIISLNTDLLLAMVNDVLDLPSLESAKMSVRIMSVSILEICKFSLVSVEKHVKPDVKLVFANEGSEDAIIRTDPYRVKQVLINLLMNAAKFTEKGTITLSYSLNADRSKATFVVTDTGIGIPRGKEEVIFSRFEKLDSHTQGNGLGLYIGRLLAELLSGSLTLDTTYRKGARFVLTIPIK